MGKIRQLDRHVADLIAAGEVVERPASVVKELVENSIDAGADNVIIEIRNGGMAYIRVTDNGVGIDPEDAETAFLRHATSKLQDARGLEAIGTLGFRGEALAAIAAVSRVELLSRRPGADEGVRVTIQGGTFLLSGPAGCPEGTTMVVRDLFFNTPARRKFMKTDKAEGSGVSAAVIRLALSHPEVSIRYIKDGKEELHTPGDGRVDSCVYSVFGREFASGLLEVGTSDGDVAVTGFISSPRASRGNRSYQFFFVNGRNVKSKSLQAALEQAYKNSLMTGRFPACVLYITLSPAAVDVNVHPAKTEVKFANEKAVFDGVYYAALGALTGGGDTAEIAMSESTMKMLSQGTEEKPSAAARGMSRQPTARVKETSPGFYRTMTADQYRSKIYAPKTERSSDPISDGRYAKYVRASQAGAQAEPPQREPSSPARKEPAQAAVPAEPAEQTSYAAAPEYRYIGEAQNTYLIVECGESLWLIDKHAAHERMNFDRLKSGDYEVMAQPLIMPVVCRLGHENAERIMSVTDMLEPLGFEIDRFSEDSVAVRQIPSEIDAGEVEDMLSDICESLAAGSDRVSLDGRRDEILHTVACKAAIKAGRMTDPGELDELITRVLSGEIRYCPHGRPVALELTKRTLDRGFGRITG